MFNPDHPYENVNTGIATQDSLGRHREHDADDESDHEVTLTIAHTIVRDTEPRTCIVPSLQIRLKQSEVPHDDNERIKLVLKSKTIQEAATFFDVSPDDEKLAEWHDALTADLAEHVEKASEEEEPAPTTQPPADAG